MQHPRIGMIGLGLMGLGIATNIVKKGYGLTAMEHPGNQPLTALIEAGTQTAVTAQAVAQASFKACKGWRSPVSRISKDIHGAIPTANRNQGRKCGSVVDCNIDGPLGPLQPFIFREKRRSQQHKRPQGHPSHAQPLRCRHKIRRRHALIQPFQQLFVHCLKSDRNLENNFWVVTPQ